MIFTKNKTGKQGLGALTALAENLGSALSTYMVAHSRLSLTSGRSDALFTHDVHMYMWAKWSYT